MVVKRIGFVGFDRLTALDLFGPMQVFDAANNRSRNGGKAYELLVLSASGRPFTTESGLSIQPHGKLAEAPALDTVIVPGGCGLRERSIGAPVVQWLRERAPTVRRMASVCTGIYALAGSGLLDGRRATTHWRFAPDVALRFPKIRLEPDAIFLRDSRFFTAAGVTTGIDLSLFFVEEDLGESVALAVARDLVVYLKRPGGQMQFSEPLRFQMRSTDRFADLAAWIVRHLEDDLSVGVLADRVRLGRRHFSRRFKATFGLGPAEYVEKLRLDEARRRLPRHNQTVESIGLSVGYASATVFGRAFERRFGIAPSTYREQFGRGTVPAEGATI
ncbi:MAG TPA: GlxA family transcriptional regulator [Steroidobacteraceae bacterium]|nr:GlxA family transcriptional regulator [Steroidobacteraceae bacterium]